MIAPRSLDRAEFGLEAKERISSSFPRRASEFRLARRDRAAKGDDGAQSAKKGK